MERLVAAAQAADIELCLIPVFYQMGGFKQNAKPEQRRFISHSIDDYWELLAAAQKLASQHRHVSFGCGVHSLRAAQADDVITIFNDGPAGSPMHIHVSEQQ